MINNKEYIKEIKSQILKFNKNKCNEENYCETCKYNLKTVCVYRFFETVCLTHSSIEEERVINIYIESRLLNDKKE